MDNRLTKYEWINSIQTLVPSVNYNYIQLCSISLVPEGLKKWNGDAYIPRKVSIGPRFKGSREDLLLMEDVKLRCMLSLIHRGAGEVGVSLKKCSDVVWELDEEVRASYVTHIELQQHELSKIMLLDGCFLLELLISKGLDSQLPSSLIPPGPAAEVLKDEDVLSDLMLLENQIPILVLHKLPQTLFPDEFEQDLRLLYSRREEQRIETEEQRIERERTIERIERKEQRKRELRAKKINNLALSVFGYSSLHLPCLEASHIIDLVHFFINRRTPDNTSTPKQDEYQIVLDIVIDTTQTQKQQVKLKRCALRLLTSGITINVKLPEDKVSTGFGGLSCFSLVWNSLCGMLLRLCNVFLVNGKHFDADDSPEEVELKGLDFYFKFEKGKLEIEQLHITKTTKSKWCNLIAWEHHKKYKYASCLEQDNEDKSQQNTSKTVSGGKFTWAALIFNGLICSPDDVQLLKDKKIVVDHLKMSNQEVMEFFHKIAVGADHKIVDSSSYIQMVDDINNYSYKAFIFKRMWRTVWISFTYRQEWLLTFLNRNYNFVATVVSVLAVVQTVYTILAYYFPK